MSVLPVLVRPVFVPLAHLKRSTDPYLHVQLLAAGKKRGKSVVFELKNGPGPIDETTTGSKDAPSFASRDLTAADIDAMDAILTDECVFASRPRRFGPSFSSPPFDPPGQLRGQLPTPLASPLTHVPCTPSFPQCICELRDKARFSDRLGLAHRLRVGSARGYPGAFSFRFVVALLLPPLTTTAHHAPRTTHHAPLTTTTP